MNVIQLLARGISRYLGVAARHDVVLLDWHLGEGPTGVDVCRRARERGSMVPIVMLTANDSVSDRLQALHAGADAHFVKGSVSPRERCKRLSVTYFHDRERRASIPPASGSANTIGPVTTHLRERTAFLGGELIPLTVSCAQPAASRRTATSNSFTRRCSARGNVSGRKLLNMCSPWDSPATASIDRRIRSLRR